MTVLRKRRGAGWAPVADGRLPFTETERAGDVSTTIQRRTDIKNMVDLWSRASYRPNDEVLNAPRRLVQRSRRTPLCA
jgi:hypothetical protein